MEPKAKIEITKNGFLVTVEHGFSEIYIDRKPMKGYLRDGQSKEYPVGDGEHECGVYSQGRFTAQAKHTFGAKADTRTMEVTCPHCGKKHTVEIEDAK